METPEAQSRWRDRVGTTAAFAMAALWLVAGIWKLANLSDWQLKMTQMLVPVEWSLLGGYLLAVTETFAGILLLRAAWRRWGGYLSVGLLLVFMGYVAYHYETLKGEDCSCFPWLERAVGPAFFWSDAAMVAVAFAAAWFSSPPRDMRKAGYTLLGIGAVGGVLLAVDQLSPSPDADVPAIVRIDDGELSLREGKTFVYFFNPMCPHCLDAGIAMSRLDWSANFVAVPTQDYQFGPGFIEDTGLQNVKLSPDLDLLKEKFPFEDVPYAVAIDSGKVRERLRFFEEPNLSDQLREIGFVK